MRLGDQIITIQQRFRGGWSYECWFEPQLFEEEITARGRGRNEREAIGDLLYQAQNQLGLKIQVEGHKSRKRMQRAVPQTPALHPPVVSSAP